MKVICQLTDKTVLGTDGLSAASPRYTARAVVRNKNGLYAVMYSEKFDLYSLPGGGVEEGEDVLTALRREIFEETGYTCDQIEELGIVRENRFCYDFTQENYYFLVTTGKAQGDLHLTEKEAQAGTSVQWRSLDDVFRLISGPVHNTPQRKYLQARDAVVLRAYMDKQVRRKQEEKMDIIIEAYTKERVDDCIAFEQLLRQEENFWGWEIDGEYREAVLKSFADPSFQNAISFLAYMDGKAVGRIDASIIPSHFDGSKKAYLDWICVVKSYRHCGVAQKLMSRLREHLKARGIHTLVGLIAGNPEAQRFYRSLDNALIRDEGIWIDL